MKLRFVTTIGQPYRKLGPSPLFLDPLVPGVGSQLGGSFKLNVPGSHSTGGMNTQLQARLLCSRKKIGKKYEH